MIVRSIYLLSRLCICKLLCNLIILLQGHIIGRILYPCIVKYILVVIYNPEITLKWQLIHLSVYFYLIGQTLITAEVYSILFNIRIQRL